MNNCFEPIPELAEGTEVLQYDPDGNQASMSAEILFRERFDMDMVAVYLALQNLPYNWRFSVSGFATIFACGRKRVNAALRRLEERGYVARMQRRGEAGRFAASNPVVVRKPEHLAEAIEYFEAHGYVRAKDLHYPAKPQVATVDPSGDNGAELGIVENENPVESGKRSAHAKPQVATVDPLTVDRHAVDRQRQAIYSVSDINNKSISISENRTPPVENRDPERIREDAPEGAESEAEPRKASKGKAAFRSFPVEIREGYAELESRFANPCKTESARAEAIAAYADVVGSGYAPQDVLDAHAVYRRSCEERGREAAFTMSPLSWLTKEEKGDWFGMCMRRVEAERARRAEAESRKAADEESRRAARRAEADREREESEAMARRAAEMREANASLEGLDAEEEARLVLAFAQTPEGAQLAQRAESVRGEMRAAAEAGVADPKASACRSYGLLRSIARCPAYNARFARFVKEVAPCAS